jgi:hypothetical protein
MRSFFLAGPLEHLIGLETAFLRYPSLDSTPRMIQQKRISAQRMAALFEGEEYEIPGTQDDRR